jgi:hypothetical protein
MPRIRLRDLTLALVGGAALVGLVALTAAAGTGNEASGTGSSFSNRPDGARAAYLTLRQLGYRVERSYEPLALLDADPVLTVLVLASPQARLSDQDRRALAAFAERGGVALVSGFEGALALGSSSPHAIPVLDREHRVYRALRGEMLSTPGDEADLTEGALEVTMAAEVRDAGFGSGYVPLYGASGEDVVLSARLGEGRIVWWAGSSPLTNEAIADAHNFELLLNVLGGGERVILWDEHYHGYGRSLWSYAAGTPLPLAAAQLALLAVAALLTWSRRPGPIRPRVLDARTSPMEFVDTMGGLYERAAIAHAAVSAAARRLRRALAASSGLSADARDEQLATTAAERMGFSREALAALLQEADEPASDPTATLDLVARLQSATARARASGRGRPA